MTSEYLSSDFNYKKYSLEQLDNWLHDAINCEDLTPQDIYNTIVRCVDDNIEYHKSNLTKNIEVLSLLKGNRPVLDFLEEYETTPFSEASERDWEDFWSAECSAVADKEKCREYNLREAEYYNKRAKLDAEYEAIKAAGGYEWTPDSMVSRNDPTRIKYEDGWVYESPDGGKTVTKRKPGSNEKIKVIG